MARASLVLIILLVTAARAGAASASAEHWVEKDGIKIYLWEKSAGNPSGKPIVMLAHGSATAGKESFDLHTRGFGRSTHPDAHFTTQQASEDLDSAVDYVLKLRGAKRVNLLAWS